MNHRIKNLLMTALSLNFISVIPRGWSQGLRLKKKEKKCKLGHCWQQGRLKGFEDHEYVGFFWGAALLLS